MATQLSNDAAHKLQASLNHDWPDPDKDLPATYIDACRRWYAALSDEERLVTVLAFAAFAKGNKAEAEKIAAALPPAPQCPAME